MGEGGYVGGGGGNNDLAAFRWLRTPVALSNTHLALVVLAVLRDNGLAGPR